MLNKIEELLKETATVRQWNIDAIREHKVLENKVIHYIESLLVARRLSWSLLRLHFRSRLNPLAWLYCQEDQAFGRFFQDIYEYVSGKFSESLLEACSREVSTFFEKETGKAQRFVVAIDECHRLIRHSRGVFLPRNLPFLDGSGNLTNDGCTFLDYYNNDNIFRKPQIFFSLRSVFPLVMEGFIAKGAQTLVVLGTNLELNSWTELEYVAANCSKNCEILNLMQFHIFSPDDVVFILRECLNNQGLTLANVKEIASEMQGKYAIRRVKRIF